MLEEKNPRCENFCPELLHPTAAAWEIFQIFIEIKVGELARHLSCQNIAMV